MAGFFFLRKKCSQLLRLKVTKGKIHHPVKNTAVRPGMGRHLHTGKNQVQSLIIYNTRQQKL